MFVESLERVSDEIRIVYSQQRRLQRGRTTDQVSLEEEQSLPDLCEEVPE